MAKLAFPENFKWGTATASYQIEGGAKQDGRGESIWDRFCEMRGNVLNGDTGETAADHYNRYKEDVALMKELGYKAYRFSISWSRVLPAGHGEISEKGLDFYSNLVDELLANGIEPFATIYHWDLPQAIQDAGGWQNEATIEYFVEYCRILYRKLGGRVKNWITLNEPYCTAMLGNFTGDHAPGIRDLGTALRVSYNVLRAHGAAVRLFREMKMEGEIGITINVTPTVPASGREQDKTAARLQDGFDNRWFLDPVLKGTFPADMIELFKNRGITLPDFKEAASICEKLDFLGINFYFSNTMRHNENAWPLCAEAANDGGAYASYTDRNWPIDPNALRDILIRIHKEYDAPKIYITENGASYNDIVNVNGEIKDYSRIDYLHRHFEAIHSAIGSGADIRGYFLWSFLDNFEWAFGYSSRFGIVFIDFETQKRTPKQSAYWHRDVIKNNGIS